ncbi:tRNA epoxyqueuosine(34) reductase QueG [bacterium]|nr:tRNA epoxyqueuosine(34) reductase QueG [bacterium]
MPETMTTKTPDELAALVKAQATVAGFDLVGIAPAVEPTGWSRFLHWLEEGFAGEMEYIPRRQAAYAHPEGVMPTVRSVIMVAINYGTVDQNNSTHSAVEAEASLVPGRVAQYAWGTADYHDYLKARLHTLAAALHATEPTLRTRAVVDTAPLLERDFARLAGLGWFGKNTMLINKRQGSFLLLGALLTDAEITADVVHGTSHCGTCTRCLVACPTEAFPEPGVLDARRCIAYLTIELKGSIPTELRSGMGDWLFGCDVCQDVCPWNWKSPRATDPVVQPQPALQPADAGKILMTEDTELRRQFRGTPLSRPGPAGLKRNAAMVLGNSKNPAAIEALVIGLTHSEAMVRGSCAWALGQIGTEASHTALIQQQAIEDNPEVQAELTAALQ